MPHLPPLHRDAVPEFKTLFEHYENTRGFIPNSILTMSRRPGIARAFMQLNQAILYEGTVEEELKMLVSLVASQAAGCLYCQAHMANLSSIYEASGEKIAAVWEFETSDLFSDAERAALSLAMKASIIPNQAEQEDFDELAKYFEEYPSKVAQKTIGDCGWQPGKHG